MSGPLEAVLKLVAEGRLTAEEAAPILDALSAAEAGERAAAAGQRAAESGQRAAESGMADAELLSGQAAGGATPKFARIQIMEDGRRVVDLRVPTSLGRFALGRVPGLSSEHIAEIQDAISTGLSGPLLNIEDEDGDGVRIVLE